MCKAVAPYSVRLAARFAFAGVTAALLAGCADSRQFVGDPLGNPFKTASTDPAPTGSLEPRGAASDMGGRDMGGRDMAPPPYQPRSAIVSHPLAAPSGSPRRVASYEAPAPRETYSAPRAAYAAPSGHGSWSSAGGMAIVAANGETANVLAERYNVPADALLRANNFRSAADIRPGTRLVIPVYTAGGSHVAVSEPAPPRGRERLARVISDRKAKRDAERQAAAEQVAEREEARSKAAKHASEGDTMHWKRGAQPARTAEADPKARRQAELEAKRAAHLAELEEARQARKTAKAETHERKTKVAKVEVEDTPIPAKPAKIAREEPAATPRKAQTDPTPTASLPPADEKVATNATSGGPEFRWPARGRIIQGFKTGGNDGINIAVPEGTSVKAAESGVVAYAGNEIKGFGNLVLIRHPNGFVSAYANNGVLDVHRGEQVKRGQTIATSGQSGNVASPQLHFELRKGSTPVDPTRYLAGL